jgi:hypothetical protein
MRLQSPCRLRHLVNQQNAKPTYVLVESLNHLGDLENHFKGEPTLTLAVAFCVSAIELVKSLNRDFPP